MYHEKYCMEIVVDKIVKQKKKLPEAFLCKPVKKK